LWVDSGFEKTINNNGGRQKKIIWETKGKRKLMRSLVNPVRKVKFKIAILGGARSKRDFLL